MRDSHSVQPYRWASTWSYLRDLALTPPYAVGSRGWSRRGRRRTRVVHAWFRPCALGLNNGVQIIYGCWSHLSPDTCRIGYNMFTCYIFNSRISVKLKRVTVGISIGLVTYYGWNRILKRSKFDLYLINIYKHLQTYITLYKTYINVYKQ